MRLCINFDIILPVLSNNFLDTLIFVTSQNVMIACLGILIFDHLFDVLYIKTQLDEIAIGCHPPGLGTP